MSEPLTVYCTGKVIDELNQLIGYKLQDSSGNTLEVKTEAIVDAIRSNKIVVTNLELNTYGILLEPEPKTVRMSKEELLDLEIAKVEKTINKAKILGYTVIEIKTHCNNTCYLLSNVNTHILYIPDNVTMLNESEKKLTFTQYLCDLEGSIKVIGGRNLHDISYMFCGCKKLRHIDLSNFSTDNVVKSNRLFYICNANIESSDKKIIYAYNMRWLSLYI